MNLEEEFKVTKNAIKNASEYGLEVEVIVYALKFMKEDPNLSIVEAVIAGYEEWIR